ncbi:GNAT family N-acetyltransferase [Trinickia dinghuensis]|uniref:GNAT family N-acetyltransferase n=1 Tax=Trinickia dinghuensis TaxID=2291023 RepID=A0A3D8JRN1_9BURK|nr:GNAT family N-acetyltransferase [Trinickia dinghuensis]RDU95081.1 GNAT family N-acetyltransferase [Trinickia dinghuensis]
MHTIRPMIIGDYDAVIGLMSATPGVSVRDADSREATGRYLERNPGLSFVAEADSRIVGCIMCGHDGRRGYLQHLVVRVEHRRQGIADALVERCLTALDALGIRKSHVDVFKTNEAAAAFWARQGWKLRTDIDRYSVIRGGGDNA